MRFLFFLERELHLPMLHPVMQYIAEQNLGEIAVYTFSYRESTEQTAGWGVRESFLKQQLSFSFTIVSDPFQYQPDITFMADFSYQYTEGLGTIVNVGHGTISKGWFFSSNSISRRENCADLICVPGTIHKEILSEQVFTNIAVTGMPKLDSMFLRTNEDKTKILTKIDLNPYTKTVLFAPTFNQEFSLVPFVGDEIERLVPKNFNLIIKMHGAAPENWKTLYKDLAAQHRRIYYWESMDITTALFVSDILITDYSSVIYEFIAQQKPVLLFDSPKRFSYPNFSEDSLENKYRNVGLRFDNPSMIPSLIEKIVLQQSLPDVDHIAQKFISVRDGSATKNVVEKALTIHQQKQLKGSIILRSDDETYIQDFKKKHADYQIIGISNAVHLFTTFMSPTANWMQDFVRAATEAKHEHILYLSNDWTLSPLFVPLSFSQFHYQDFPGFIAPLYWDNKVQSQQRFLSLYKQIEMSPEQAALQITYASCGIANTAEYIPTKDIFATKKEFIPKHTEKEQIFWMQMQLNALVAKQRLAIGYDLLAYKTMTKKKAQPQKLKGLFRKIQSSELELRNKIEKYPAQDSYLYDLILFYYHAKQYLDMEVYANMIPNKPLAKLYSAIAMEKQQHIKRASETIQKLEIKDLSTEAKCEYYSLLGRLALKQNRFEEGKAAFEKALSINANYVHALLGIGSAFLMVHDVANAKQYYNKILSIEPDNVSALFGLGAIAQAEQNAEKGIYYFGKVLQNDEERIQALQPLLQCAYAAKKFDTAAKALETYLDYHPANLDMSFTLAGVYYEMKNYDRALELIENIHILNPNYNGLETLRNKIETDRKK